MSRLEDGLREVLTERAGPVMPPTGWEYAVLAAGRRRQLRRRLGATLGAAIGVFAVMLVANVVLPPDWAQLDPASKLSNGQHGEATAVQAAATSRPIDPAKLPTGAASTVAYAAGDGSVPPGDVVVLPNGARWKTSAYVTAIEEAGDGVVAELSSHVNQLMYRWPGGTRELARGNFAGFAVSSDGTQVAWTQTSGDGGLPAVLKLANLPSGEVVEALEVDGNSAGPDSSAASAGSDGSGGPQPDSSVPFVSSFLGDLVTLSYDVPVDESPPGYAWDPARRTIQSIGGNELDERAGKLVDVSVDADTMLMLDVDGCLAGLSLKAPGTQRWRSCDEADADWPAAKRLSPQGTWVAGTQGSVVWVRDARTGKLLWSRELANDLKADALVWESEDRLLVTYDDPGDPSYGRSLLRCEATEPTCDRPSTVDGQRVAALASRQGTDPPVMQR